MHYKDYLTPERVILLKSETKEQVFAELAHLICRQNPRLKYDQVLSEIWERENMVTTNVAPGIAIPHAKLAWLDLPVIVVGKSVKGIDYDVNNVNKVYLFVMILSDNDSYLPLLSGIASRLNQKQLYDKIIAAQTTHEIYKLLTTSADEVSLTEEKLKISRSLFRHACTLLKEIAAKALIVYADALGDIGFILQHITDEKVYIITQYKEKYQNIINYNNTELIQVPFHGLDRGGQLEIAQLFIAAKGLLKKGDKVVSVYGKQNSGVFDAVIITDIESVLGDYFPFEPGLLPPDLKHEVFARTIQLANNLAYEGREGKPVGAIFVLADHEHVARYCRQMVVNPFKGLKEDERNILDPSLEETIKEFSKLDGALIIRGDGVIITSGAYLSTHTPHIDFQPGLGARHAAAASITSATQALAVVISESTRKISIFKSGKRFIVI